MTAIPPDENPVAFWKSEKTKLADCLWSLVARMVMTTTKKLRMFHTTAKVEI